MNNLDESYQSTAPLSTSEPIPDTTHYALRGSNLNKFTTSRNTRLKLIKHPILTEIDINVAKGKMY